VLDADGDPLIGVSVALMVQRVESPLGERRWFAHPTTMTNDLGEFRLFDVPPRKYYVRATYTYGAPPLSYADSAGVMMQAAFAATYYPGVTNVAQASPVTLHAGSEVRNVDIRMAVRRLATFRGQIAG